MRLRHILVPTDLGELSEHATAAAADLASSFDAKITLLHVWSIPSPTYVEALTWPVDNVESAARDALGQAHARLKEKHPNTDAVLTPGAAWERILETAKELGVDMIVMATHGRRGVPRWLVGSVTEKVVRASPVPVLTIPAEKG